MSKRENAKTDAVEEFVKYWTGRGSEKSDSQKFWLDLLRDVLGAEHPERGTIEFEDKAGIDTRHGFIDGFIAETKVMIEQKSLGKSLTAKIKQSDGTELTPVEQARRYIVGLPLSRHPRWVVTCNFAQFLIYDMEHPGAAPESILLKDLPREWHRLAFLVDRTKAAIRREEALSKAAGAVVGRMYDALLARYRNPGDPETLKSLNELCVRLVFLMYAEDAPSVFKKAQFHDYLAAHRIGARTALKELFKTLDTPEGDRDPYLDADLADFPYVNGGLFKGEVEIPNIDGGILDLILREGCEEFDWSGISPVIFGALFESTLNPETRRKDGMHYTSVENIHKVIDPLFLDALKARLEEATGIANRKKRVDALWAFIDHIASLTFLDPACGSGNFLTETFICLRRLENKALHEILGKTHGGLTQPMLGKSVPKVSISQFHGIEINDFAARVAQTALWIAESQMLSETEKFLGYKLEFLPLKDFDGIAEGNALRMDWAELNRGGGFDYIIGNPPFVGARLMGAEQKADVEAVFGKGWKGIGNLDYVACWYKKAADIMAANPDTRTALVSTNSVCQGDAVATLWKPLSEDGFGIDFAHRTFRWDSESDSKAHVHCVIVGFSRGGVGAKLLFDGGVAQTAKHINAYLLDAPDVFVESRKTAVSADLPMVFGSMPNDGGYLSDWSPERRNEVIGKWPQAKSLFRRITGSDEYIKGVERWCLWLKDANPNDIRSIPPVMDAIGKVRDIRLASKRAATRKLAEKPMLFGEIRQPERGDILLVPATSSEQRKYVPIGFIPVEIVLNNAALFVPGATLYHFGVLTSGVHMAWMRTVAGRLEMRYRYSAQIVYNNFPWPEPTAAQKRRIEETAQGVLDARAKFPGSSLAALYDELTMPPELRRAHQENDRAVMAAYGFKAGMPEEERVAELFKMYRELAKR